MSLFTLSNGASVRITTAKELVNIPVWKNNRIIDYAHVEEIKKNLTNICHLDNGYHIASLTEEDATGRPIVQRYIIDGQHRHQVLRQHFENVICAQDFNVLVFERHFESEGDLIEYFNVINNRKPVQQWKDENLILNNYVKELEAAFHTRYIFIRSAGCHRPYLSVDKLRDALRSVLPKLPTTFKGAREFAEKAKAWNDAAVKNELFVLGIANAKKREFFEKGARVGFVLAYDDKFAWIKECL
jgi:hypothetical protein